MKRRKNFYPALAKVAHLFNWTTNNGIIRGRLKEGPTYWDFCPLTAVHYIRTKELKGTASYGSVGTRMGLTYSDSAYIATGADCPLTGDKKIRKALLRAVGLDS